MIVYVRPSRHTYNYMEKNNYFTVSFYDDEYKKALGYLGTKSGRDTDKVKDVGFTKKDKQKCLSFYSFFSKFIAKVKYFIHSLDSFKL